MILNLQCHSIKTQDCEENKKVLENYHKSVFCFEWISDNDGMLYYVNPAVVFQFWLLKIPLSYPWVMCEDFVLFINYKPGRESWYAPTYIPSNTGHSGITFFDNLNGSNAMFPNNIQAT